MQLPGTHRSTLKEMILLEKCEGEFDSSRVQFVLAPNSQGFNDALPASRLINERRSADPASGSFGREFSGLIQLIGRKDCDLGRGFCV